MRVTGRVGSHVGSRAPGRGSKDLKLGEKEEPATETEERQLITEKSAVSGRPREVFQED